MRAIRFCTPPRSAEHEKAAPRRQPRRGTTGGNTTVVVASCRQRVSQRGNAGRCGSELATVRGVGGKQRAVQRSVQRAAAAAARRCRQR